MDPAMNKRKMDTGINLFFRVEIKHNVEGKIKYNT